jgi:hypothetical protein
MSYKATMSKKVQVNEKKFCKMCFDAKREGYDTHYLKDFTGPEVKVVCPYLLALQCNYCKEQGHTISYCPILKKTKETKPAKQEGSAGAAGSKRIYSLRADNDQTPYPNKDWLFDRETETYIRIPPPPRLVRQNAIAVDDNNTGDYYVTPMATTNTNIKTKTKTKGNSVKTTNAYESLFDSESDEETATSSSAAVAVPPPPAPQTESRLWADIAAKIPVQQKKRVQFQTQTQTQTQTHQPLPELPSFTLKKKTPITDAFFKYTPMSNWADDSDSEDN